MIQFQIRNLCFLIFHTILGLVLTISAVIGTLTFLPIYMYRWLLTQYLIRWASPSYGKAVTVTGHLLAVEFLPSCIDHSPRSCIIANLYLKGHLSLDTLSKAVRKGWLEPDNNGHLKYPEFQQYIDHFGGYMFWRNEPKFELGEHIFSQKTPEPSSPEVSQAILSNLVESLMNKPLARRKSPWELHLLHNYQDLSICKEDNMTVIVCRLHHGLVDGFSFLHAVVHGLLNQNLPSIEVQAPSKEALGQTKNTARLVNTISSVLYNGWRLIHDVGYMFDIQIRFLGRWKTPFHISDRKKAWKQLCARSDSIPVDKVKHIKNQLGGYFTGVILSCLAAGVADYFKQKGYHGGKLPVGSIVPVKKHPDKLRNNLTGTFLELDASADLDPIKRLHSTQAIFHDARFYSQIPLMMAVFTKLVAGLPSVLINFLGKNRITPVGISNFPGPGISMDFLGNPGVGLEFSVGGVQGVCGLTFCVVSYNNHIRITLTAESGVMTRQELTNVMQTVTNELDKLYEIAGTEITIM